MLDIKFTYSEYSIFVQALLNRMDYLQEMVKRTSLSDEQKELCSLFKEDYKDVRSLYYRLKLE